MFTDTYREWKQEMQTIKLITKTFTDAPKANINFWLIIIHKPNNERTTIITWYAQRYFDLTHSTLVITKSDRANVSNATNTHTMCLQSRKNYLVCEDIIVWENNNIKTINEMKQVKIHFTLTIKRVNESLTKW